MVVRINLSFKKKARTPFTCVLLIPTYEEIKTRTENKALITRIAELFKLGDPNYHILVDPAKENWNCIFECLEVLSERLDELDIEGML